MKHTSFRLLQTVNGGEIREGDNSLLVRKNADGSHEYFVANDAGNWQPLLVEVAEIDAPAPDPDPIPDPDPTDPDPIPDPVPDPVAADVNGPAELAQAVATAGTYTLAGGDYGGLRVPVPNGTTLKAADPANPPRFSDFTLNSHSDVTFDGLHFKYTYSDGDPDTANRFLVKDCTRVKIINCLIEGDRDASGSGKGRGLHLLGSNQDCVIEGNEIHTWWKGLGLQGDTITARANNIHTIRSDGINTGPITNVLIELNYIHDFGTSEGDSDHRDALQMQGPATGVIIRNNFFDENGGLYFQVLWSDAKKFMENVLIEFNTIIASHANGIAMHNVGVIRVIDNDMVWQPRDNAASQGIQTPKINLSSGQATVERNRVPGIISPSGVDHLNTIQDGDPVATRAAARADARWSHFFGV